MRLKLKKTDEMAKEFFSNLKNQPVGLKQDTYRTKMYLPRLIDSPSTLLSY